MSKKHPEDVKKQIVTKENLAGSSTEVTDKKDAKKFSCVLCGREFNVHMNLIAHFRYNFTHNFHLFFIYLINFYFPDNMEAMKLI